MPSGTPLPDAAALEQAVQQYQAELLRYASGIFGESRRCGRRPESYLRNRCCRAKRRLAVLLDANTIDTEGGSR